MRAYSRVKHWTKHGNVNEIIVILCPFGLHVLDPENNRMICAKFGRCNRKCTKSPSFMWHKEAISVPVITADHRKFLKPRIKVDLGMPEK